ncbi:MAG: hypothetical protein FJ026_11085 [Chloroflexi bacterium]|nr:hypothetical protein [Chloroflexota bacterium]
MHISETFLFATGAACVIGGALAYMMSVMRRSVLPGDQPTALGTAGSWRNIEQALGLASFLCTAAGLVLATVQGNRWPLTVPTEVVFASAGFALLWQIQQRQRYQPRWAPLLCYLLVFGLLLWAIVRWPTAENVSRIEEWQQAWTATAHLALAVACGAFVQAGGVALASLLSERDNQASSPQIGSNVALWGLAALTTSLGVTSVGGLHTRGMPWSWTSSESWQLLLWLFYAVLWCAQRLLVLRRRQVCILAVAGLLLVLIMLGTTGAGPT